MVITYGNPLYCPFVAEGNVDKKTSILEYKNRSDYECFNNPFTAKSGSPDLHLLLITIDYRSRMHKRSCYTPDLLPGFIFVAFGNYVSTLTTPSDSPQLLILPYDDTKPTYASNKYDPYRGRMKRGYCCRKNYEKYAIKRQGSIAPGAMIDTRNIITVMDFPG